MSMFAAIKRVFAPVFLLLSFALPAAASPLAQVDTPHAVVEIFTEPADATGGADTVWLAVRFTPDAGWHTYWKNYGDTGKAPQFDWQLPQGWDVAPPLYPVPERIPVGFLMNYGYGHPNTLLFEVTPADGAVLPADITMDARWLICEEVCVPESGSFAFTIAEGAGADAATKDVFRAARDALPEPIPFAVTAAANSDAFALSVAMTADEAALVRDVYYFPEEKGLIDYQVDQIREDGDGTLRLVTARPAAAGSYERTSGILVVENAAGIREGFALSADIQPDAALAAPAGGDGGGGTLAAAQGDAGAGADSAISLFQAFLFALLGGAILNLMPCVFPVLSLKAFALIRSHGAGEAAARQDGLAYAAGILASFALVAGVFLALKSAGAQIGWGFQLQSPLVVGALALLLFLVGLNLIGVYDFSAGRLSGVGQGLAERGGRTGAFFTGVLATVVATPCTAPFMAPALGFALFQPAPIAVGIFLSLGLGLALPYLLIAYIPPLRRVLPKPGPWMETFRQFLAFPMFLAAIWLVWVLAQQGGAEAVAGALAAMLVAAFAIWLVRKLRGQGGLAAPAAGLSAGLVMIVTVLGLSGGLSSSGPSVADATASTGGDSSGFEQALGVEPWSRDRVAEMRAEGRPVFAYFTAAWCITCKVNERVALAADSVREAVKASGIAVLKADWTNQNADIAQELERFGRSGVPMYVYYPADGGAPRLLPEVLTPDIVTRAFADGAAERQETG